MTESRNGSILIHQKSGELRKPVKIEFLPSVQQGLAEAVEFYEEQLAGTGVLFYKEVSETLDLIRLFPEGWQMITKLTSTCCLHNLNEKNGVVSLGSQDQDLLLKLFRNAVAHFIDLCLAELLAHICNWDRTGSIYAIKSQ